MKRELKRWTWRRNPLEPRRIAEPIPMKRELKLLTKVLDNTMASFIAEPIPMKRELKQTREEAIREGIELQSLSR